MQRSPGFTAAQGDATRENIEHEGCAGVAIRRRCLLGKNRWFTAGYYERHATPPETGYSIIRVALRFRRV